jgi:RNA polymerase sigma-70 factor (ECF subfamily)
MSATALAMGTERDVEIAAAIRDRTHHRALAMMTRELGPALGRFCAAILGNRAEAEEAAQDALIEALRAMSGFRGESAVRTWLFAIARRICFRRLKRRRHREALLHVVSAVEVPSPDSPLDEAARTELFRRLQQAMETLPLEERELLALRYQADLTYEEAAEVCGISPDAARKRASRAFAVLRDRLGGDP